MDAGWPLPGGIVQIKNNGEDQCAGDGLAVLDRGSISPLGDRFRGGFSELSVGGFFHDDVGGATIGRHDEAQNGVPRNIAPAKRDRVDRPGVNADRLWRSIEIGQVKNFRGKRRRIGRRVGRRRARATGEQEERAYGNADEGGFFHGVGAGCH